MNHRWIIVYDLETDGPDPTTANPVEIAAVPVNPRTLEIKMDDTFEVQLNLPVLTKMHTSQLVCRRLLIGTHLQEDVHLLIS